MLAQAIEEDERRHRQQQVQPAARVLHQVGLTLRAGFDGHLLGPEPGHRHLAHAFLEAGLEVVDDGAVGHVDGRLGRLEGRARLQPGEHVGPVVAPVLEALPVRR